MSFHHSKSFKYLKNLLIGLGASIVLLGALAKLQSYDWQIAGIDLIDLGLWVEASTQRPRSIKSIPAICQSYDCSFAKAPRSTIDAPRPISKFFKYLKDLE